MKQIKKDSPIHFFSEREAVEESAETGSLELRPLYPFIISGGKNTERYYFKHISAITDYKFNVRPEYFGEESSYVDVFPKRINAILDEEADAKIFCVFDWDTVYANSENMRKHKQMERQLEDLIQKGRVVLCPSMPSIEYWFLLHFENRTELMKNYGKVNNYLTPYLKPLLKDKLKNTSIPSMGSYLKKEKYLKSPEWVEILCDGGRLETAITNSERNIAEAQKLKTLENQSYSYVYLAFNGSKNAMGKNLFRVDDETSSGSPV